MSDGDSDDNTIYWVLAVVVSIIIGIFFFFNKTVWPQLNPILRCLIAPLAGVIILAGGLLYAYLYNFVVTVVIMGTWKVFLWLTTPRVVFPVCLLVAIGASACLLFHWAATPLVYLLECLAVGTVGGFIVVRLMRVAITRSWVLQSIIGIAVALFLPFLVLKNFASGLLDGGSLALAFFILMAFIIRFLYEEHQVPKKTVGSYQSVNSSRLSKDMKSLVLTQVKDKLGSAQYNKLVSAIGEDEIINHVLANLNKT